MVSARVKSFELTRTSFRLVAGRDKVMLPKTLLPVLLASRVVIPGVCVEPMFTTVPEGLVIFVPPE